MIRTLLLASALTIGFAFAEDPKPKATPTDMSVLPGLVEAIAKADKVVLLEGLPHQFFERGLLKSELEKKKTVKISDYPFYAEPLDLKDEHGKKLTELTVEDSMFKRVGIPKLCGGFHPDYAVEFAVGKEKYHMLICFGCGEAILVGPKSAVRCDIREEGPAAFEAVLKGYRKNRPEKKD